MQIKKIIDAGYLIVLGSSIGGILTLGIVMTSTIFHSANYIGPLLSHYQEGLIMSGGFDKFSYFLSCMFFVILFYEMYSYKILQRDKTVLLSAFVSLLTIGLFVGVYTPQILEMQKLGAQATASEAFNNLHVGSELDFKVLVVSLIILMGRRLYVLLGKNTKS
ncbi:DUF4149 domain-containing protein [Sulfurimonas sp. MAG313]|nr:DUF4149 domain-containing protein [Sulfurimonas sp. MAG313]MDF1881048.1 DUF4149 domain-containing protein [Sulfurimonas sp. MAG313]